MKFKILALLVVSSLLHALNAYGVQVSSVLTSHMVLQRDKPVMIWGKANKKQLVYAAIDHEILSTRANEYGDWEVKFAPRSVGGPHIVTAGSETNRQEVVLDDILFGDVWLSSGQSNMEWTLENAQDGFRYADEASFSEIRFFNTEKNSSDTLQNEVRGASGIKGWHAATGQGDDRTALLKFSAVSYFFGRKVYLETGVPVGLINCAWGGTRIEPWIPSFAISESPLRGSPLYNGMIHPYTKLAIKGFLWYQGEANLWDGAAYQEKMKVLISSWRKAFGGADELGFYFTQLAPYHYSDEYKYKLPIFWETQAQVLLFPHTGMAVINDVGDVRDIHPRDKKTVGERLALWALAKDYDRKELIFSGPTLKEVIQDGDKLTLLFESVGTGIRSRDGKPLSWFEVAGDDGVYYPASAQIVSGNSFSVYSEKVSIPKSVRFAWDQAAEPNLTNGEGLPASAFRTL